LAGILTDRDLALAVLGGDLDPKTTPLGEVMSEGVIACDIKADLDEVVRLMRDQGVRRIPITENGRLVGLVTFDDLVVDGSVGLEALRSIVTPSSRLRHLKKPPGVLHPQKPRCRPCSLADAGAGTRRGDLQSRLVMAVASAAALERDRAERALLLGVWMLRRRLIPQEAQHLIALEPSTAARSVYWRAGSVGDRGGDPG
jgi:hypothetical protein